MRKLCLILIILLALTVTSPGLAEEGEEDTNEWKLSADFNLNLTQSAYSDNWEGGELGSISWNSLGLLAAEKQISARINWSTRLHTSFGQTHTQEVVKLEADEEGDDTEKKRWLKPRKSTDEIDLESVLRYTFGGLIDPYVSGRLLTKFTNENNDLFDPKDLSLSGGISRVLIEDENCSMVSRLGATYRQHIQKDRETTNDSGIEFVTDFKRVLAAKRVNFDSSLRLYRAVAYSESDVEGVNDDWKTIDLDWKNTLSFDLLKYISASFYFQLKYDKDNQVEDGVQIKQTLGLGLKYKLL